MGHRVRAAMIAAVSVVGIAGALTACGTGDDAVVQGGSFQFVSPGGQTVISYEPAERKPVAVLSGPDLVTDETVSLDDPRFAGKVVVLNVWGSWCGPCRGEAPALEEVYAATKADGVEFLGINLRDDRESAKDFVTDREVGFPSIYDFDGASLAALTTPTSVVPTTIVLDRRHRPAAVFLKAVTADELGAKVRAVAAEEAIAATEPAAGN